jgi:hypothetical protein
MVSVRRTGAAGLEFTHEGKSWLIDPYLSRVGKASIFFGRPRPDRERISHYLGSLPGILQAVIVGHKHLDHALDLPEIISSFPVQLIGSGSLGTAVERGPGALRTVEIVERLPEENCRRGPGRMDSSPRPFPAHGV